VDTDAEEQQLDRCAVSRVNAAKVSAARAALPGAATAERIAALFKVLGDPGRCRLLGALIAAGELCVCELAASAGMSESNVSHHLRLLRDTGLVQARRAGKMVYYSPGDQHVRLLLETTRAHVEHLPARGEA
jgi:DNA-binding transcriptional ArsR family regulator